MNTILYPTLAFFSVLIFALVHLGAEKTRSLPQRTQARILSMGGGVSIAYVFIDILPKLSKSDQTISESLVGIFPFVEGHAYITALLGFILFFMVDRSKASFKKETYFLISLSSYALFNFLVGYAVADINNPEVRPLPLFTIAIALHYFVNDYSLVHDHGEQYDATGRWLLIGFLFLGWLMGLWIVLSPASVALVSAFIGGGIIMNVTRHELPTDNPHSTNVFLLSAAIYTAILLSIGQFQIY